MIKNFKNKFGEQDKCIVVIGDYDKKEGFNGKESSICKGVRKILRNNKYDVYLINEYKTSLLCHKCHCENETFIERKSHRPKDRRKLIEVFGCLRCKNVKCKMIHNRDKNASLNMLTITRSILNGKGRPKIFCRKNEFIPTKR
jgi:hypothetical protein